MSKDTIASPNAVNVHKCLTAILGIGYKFNECEDLVGPDNFEEYLFAHILAISEKDGDYNDQCDELSNALEFVRQCYARLSSKKQLLSSQILDSILQLLTNHAKLIITNPDVSSEHVNCEICLINMMPFNSSSDRDFIIAIVNSVQSCDDSLKEFVRVLINAVRRMVSTVQLPSFSTSHAIDSLIFLTRADQKFAMELTLQITEDADTEIKLNSRFEHNIIANLLLKSCLPSWHFKSFAFSTEYSTFMDVKRFSETSQYQISLEKHNASMHTLIRSILANSTCREQLIVWLSKVISKFQYKGKDQSIINDSYPLRLTGDGALLNLLIVLLHLAMPFCKHSGLDKVRYHYTHCRHNRLKFLSEETMLCSDNGDSAKCTCSDNDLPNFPTDCFYMVHVCIQIVIGRLLSINKSVSNEIWMSHDMISIWRENYGNHPLFEQAELRFKESNCVRNHILVSLKQPDMVKFIAQFMSFTARWLLINIDNSAHIPEIVLSNISTFMLLIDVGSCANVLEQLDDGLYPLVKCIVVMMGEEGPSRNPHLKANLAQSLKDCFPREPTIRSTRDMCLEMFKKDNISIIKSLLHVFVTIERTGQSVSFEEKFQYRISLHDIIATLYEHKSQRYRNELQQLSHFAVEHIDDADPPLFLRFVNLLLNDANFLMDEAILAVTELRQSQDNESSQMQHHAELVHRLSLCQYRCLCNSKTLETLRLMTMSIVNIFCHDSIVDRMATMMNYFLDKLTGSERNKLKIKDNERVGFYPKSLLQTIVMIMNNLARHENFPKACAKDRGRYGERLYERTIKILERIDSNRKEIEKFQNLTDLVANFVQILVDEDASYDDAPEEFIDEITGELMSDPVQLPVSKRILDRVTIIRHLLSDQTDPFNRLPLEIKDLIPKEELKLQIEEWKLSKKNS
ncbi:hypothetical protein GJ496_002080 [Pomphorhynchus laevis]|nr:hypothetical protein GJ496_002080 [Pomphorhynchus laevis]